MAESGLVASLQERIDSVTERMKSSKLQLEQLQHSYNRFKLVLTPTEAPHLEMLTKAAPEETQSRELAIRAFNLNPRRGVELMGEANGGSTHELVTFLLGTPGINKKRLGEWLGEPSEEKTLASFAFAFPLAEQPFEKALRVYCSKVKMPESSNKIDRLLEAFASAWVSMNEAAGLSVDAAHIIAFSCIMLNNDRSGGVVSEEAFVANHRGINSGQDCPRNFLETLYRSITTHAIVTPVEQGSSSLLFTAPTKQGWLKKQGGSYKARMLRRYFVLCDSELFYFENEGDIFPKGFFLFKNLTATSEKKTVTLLPKVGESVTSAKFDKAGAMVVGNHKTLILATASEKEAKDWTSLLNA